ncbi:MAG: hypothetical protein RR327_05140 [Clostridia bacterium]
MTVNEAIEKLDAKSVCMCDGEKEIKSAYVGDFLSFAISKQGENCIWFTVMNNVNVAGVATLTDCSLIVLCDGILPDDNLFKKAIVQKINICSVKTDVYETVVKYSQI